MNRGAAEKKTRVRMILGWGSSRRRKNDFKGGPRGWRKKKKNAK